MSTNFNYFTAESSGSVMWDEGDDIGGRVVRNDGTTNAAEMALTTKIKANTQYHQSISPHASSTPLCLSSLSSLVHHYGP
jgi:hypothetical protein